MALRHEKDALRPSVLQPNEQPFAEAVEAAPLQAGRDAAGKVRTSAAARALAKLPRRPRQVPRELVVDPRFAPHDRRRREWLSKRTGELAAATGGVSVAVGAILAHAAWLHAAAEFAAELAAGAGDVEGFKTAARLSETARQHDLASWELAVREGKARHDNEDPRAAHARLLAALEEDGNK